jgi:hypothetical protein
VVDRRQAHAVAGLQAVVRPDATAIDAYLAAPEQPVDSAARQAAEAGEQEIVDPLAGLVGGHADVRHGVGGGRGVRINPGHRMVMLSAQWPSS